jgi:DedD protein
VAPVKSAPVAQPTAPEPSAKPVAASADKPVKAAETPAPSTTAPANKPVALATSATAAAAAEAARARALLEGKPVAKAAPAAVEGRFIVQVGAFAETARAQQVRQQLERAGLKTYTHVADTAEGKRIRVRLGPFSTRADAEKAAAKAKATGLPAAILTL